MPHFFPKAGSFFVFVLLILVAFAVVAAPANPSLAQDGQSPDDICAAAEIQEPTTRQFSQPETVLEEDVDYRAIFCTGNGAVYIDLFEEYSPITVNNFVFLAEAGYYNNSIFHRVIADFMAQGGDPVGNPPGTGGPGYQFNDEFTPYLGFDRPGLLAMANAGANTNGSQFFITRVPTPHLNQRHTIFGEVLEGQDVIDTMRNTEDGEGDESLNTVLIITDPNAVDSTYEAPQPATAEEVLAGVEEIFGGDPSLVSDDVAIADSVEAAIERFDNEDAQAMASELYTANNFNFEAGGLWTVSSCEGDLSLLGVAYRMVNWASAEDAEAFANSDDLPALQAALGFEPLADEGEILLRTGFTTNAIYTRANNTVCDVEATQVRHIWNFGRFSIEMDIIINNNLIEGGQIPREQIPAVMANFGYQLTPVVSEILMTSDNG